jgi:ankyrin repeat protein
MGQKYSNLFIDRSIFDQFEFAQEHNVTIIGIYRAIHKLKNTSQDYKNFIEKKHGMHAVIFWAQHFDKIMRSKNSNLSGGTEEEKQGSSKRKRSNEIEIDFSKLSTVEDRIHFVDELETDKIVEYIEYINLHMSRLKRDQRMSAIKLLQLLISKKPNVNIADDDDDDDDDEVCSVCLESNTNLVLQCGHHYHRQCLIDFLVQASHMKCTLCRATITSEPILKEVQENSVQSNATFVEIMTNINQNSYEEFILLFSEDSFNTIYNFLTDISAIEFERFTTSFHQMIGSIEVSNEYYTDLMRLKHFFLISYTRMNRYEPFVHLLRQFDKENNIYYILLDFIKNFHHRETIELVEHLNTIVPLINIPLQKTELIVVKLFNRNFTGYSQLVDILWTRNIRSRNLKHYLHDSTKLMSLITDRYLAYQLSNQNTIDKYILFGLIEKLYLNTIDADKFNEIIIKLIESGAFELDLQNEDNLTVLMICSHENHRYVNIVDKLLQGGASVNIKNNNGENVLLIAANGSSEIVNMLVQTDIDLNCQNDKNQTALMLAAEYGCNNVANILIENGANPNLQDNLGQTPLMLISEQGIPHTIDILIANGANVNLRDKNGQNAFSYALCSDPEHLYSVVNPLINAGLEFSDENGQTLLMDISGTFSYTEFSDFNYVIEKLIAMEPNINLQNKDNLTALMIASENENLEIVQMLLQHNINVDLQNKDNLTALMISTNKLKMLSLIGDPEFSIKRQDKIVEMLIQAGANQQLTDKTGNNALFFAISKNRINMVKMLLNANTNASNTNASNLNAQNNDNLTALIAAVEKGCLEIVKLLLQHNVNVDLQGDNMNTALIAAVEKECLEIVKLLLQHNVNVDLQGDNMNTALITAVNNYNLEIVKLLLQSNANVDLQNSQGNSALMLAAEYGSMEIVKLLLQKGADLNSRDEFGNSTLIAALADNHFEIIKILIEAGTDINLQCNDGTTLLMQACKYKEKYSIQIVELLIQKNVNLNLQNNFGQTALMHVFDHFNDISDISVYEQERMAIILAKKLIHAGADIELTQLSLVIGRCFSNEIVKILIEKSNDLNKIYLNHESLLIIATKGNNSKIVEALLEHDINLDIQNRSNHLTALMIAAENENLVIVQMLLQKGANANLQNSQGNTMLHIAAQKGKDRIVSYIIDNNEVDINLLNNNGNTALMLAAENENLEIVQMLRTKLNARETRIS